MGFDRRKRGATRISIISLLAELQKLQGEVGSSSLSLEFLEFKRIPNTEDAYIRWYREFFQPIVQTVIPHDERRDYRFDTLSKLRLKMAQNALRLYNHIEKVGEVMDDYAGFQYEILRTATRNFSDILGEGCSGPIFKGVLPDGREVAVKKLVANLQGEREFQNEVTVLSRLQHTNVVQLYGYCIHDSERLLVYAYATNQSLWKLLSYGTRHVTLSWEKRYSIMVDVAQGLLYLHKGSQTPIIHGDIKIDNILLCENEVTKIDDFGMARLFPTTHISSQLDNKCGSLMEDVYSYGVVLLELISREISSIPDRERRVIVERAWELYIDKKQPPQILDPVLKDTANLDQVMMCIKIALMCTQSDPSRRPDMQQVVDLLLGRESSSSIGKSCSIQNKRRRKWSLVSRISTWVISRFFCNSRSSRSGG